MVVQIGALLLMSALALGAGWMSGKYLDDDQRAALEPLRKPEGGHADGAAKNDHGETAKHDTLVDLAPITTNLAAPADSWVRLELSLIYDTPQPPEIAEAVHQDVLAYVRTLTLHQIEGASGLIHFKADLNERAALRSDGHATQVLIRTMLFE